MRAGVEGGIGEVALQKAGPCSSGDHGGVVCGEGGGGKRDGKALFQRDGGEVCAQFTIGGDTARDKDAGCAVMRGGMRCLADEVVDDGTLKRCNQVKRLLIAQRCDLIKGGLRDVCERCATSVNGVLQGVRLDVAQDARLDAAEGEVEGRPFRGAAIDFYEAEWDCAGITEGAERIEPRTAGIAQAEQLSDLVIGFAGGVVDGATDVAIVPCALLLVGQVEVRVASADDECELLLGGLCGLHQNGVDVAFKMIDGQQRFAQSVAVGLGKGDADEQGSGQTGAAGDGDCVQVVRGDASLCERVTHNGNDVAQMFAAGKLWHHAAIECMHLHLRRDDVAEHLRAVAYDSCGGFVAGTFNAEDEAGGH